MLQKKITIIFIILSVAFHVSAFSSPGPNGGILQEGLEITGDYSRRSINSVLFTAMDAKNNDFLGSPTTKETYFLSSMKGDIDGDGSVNLLDAILALRLLNGVESSGTVRSDYTTSGADVNGNNKLGNEEVIYVLQRVSGINDGSEGSGGIQNCGTQSTFYTFSPLDPESYTEITPLGNLNPPGHAFPTVHTYLMLTDKSVAVPVYAPADITITQISSSTSSSSHSMTFYPCSEVKGYFHHMTTLADVIKNQLSEADICDWTQMPTGTTPYCVSIEVTAGTILGYIGGPDSDGSAALDFGARDTRVAPIPFINPERAGVDKQQVVCPYDYYEEGAVKVTLNEKLAAARAEEPICGTVDFDVENTARGLWFLAGSPINTDESSHVALVPSNFDTSVGVLSVGNPDVGTEAYFFDVNSTGSTRREFSGVTSDGNIYCYDNLRERTDPGNSSSIPGYIILTMPTNTTLKLERIGSGSCPGDTNGLSFSASSVNFER